MNKELISVIVPVYNVEAFIDKCLNSILSQTYKNIEVVLVDDGSTDNSGKKCDEYVKKDSRVKVIHKSNGGLSSARNTGIDNSSGSFLSFIDSDDYIDSNMLEILYNGCVNNNCDIGIINKVRVDEFDNKKYDTAIVEEKKVKSEEALKLLLLSDPSACNKIYRRDLFNKIEFPIGKLYEDILTIPYLLMESKNIYLNPNFGYYYFQRSNSIVNSKFKPQKMDYLFNSLKLREDVVKKYKSLEEVADANIILNITVLLSSVYDERKKYKNEFNTLLTNLKLFNKKYISNKYISRKKKIMIFFDLHHMIWVTNIIKKIRRK